MVDLKETLHNNDLIGTIHNIVMPYLRRFGAFVPKNRLQLIIRAHWDEIR